MALAPIITDGIRKYIAIPVEACRRNTPANGWESFKAVFGILVPAQNDQVRFGVSGGGSHLGRWRGGRVTENTYQK